MAEENTGIPPYLVDNDGHVYPYNEVFAAMPGMRPKWKLDQKTPESSSSATTPPEASKDSKLAAAPTRPVAQK